MCDAHSLSPHTLPQQPQAPDTRQTHSLTATLSLDRDFANKRAHVCTLTHTHLSWRLPHRAPWRGRHSPGNWEPSCCESMHSLFAGNSKGHSGTAAKRTVSGLSQGQGVFTASQSQEAPLDVSPSCSRTSWPLSLRSTCRWPSRR